MFNVAVDMPYWWNLDIYCSTYGELQMAEEFTDWRMVKHSVFIENQVPVIPKPTPQTNIVEAAPTKKKEKTCVIL